MTTVPRTSRLSDWKPAASWTRPTGRPAAVETTLANRMIISALVGLAALAVWVVAFGLLLSALTESHDQHSLYQSFRQQLSDGTAPLSDAVPRGTPVALLNATGAGIHGLVVVQGTSSNDLQRGPGHSPGAPLPGQPGVSVLMGRSASYGAPFAHITSLDKGDKLTAVTGQGTFHYVVEDVRRPGDPFPPTLAPTGSQLTLITTEGGGWRAGWAPSNAVFVDAVLTGAAKIPPGTKGVPASVDAVMARDTGGMYPMVLWLQLLAVAVIGGFWARARWGHWQTWLVVGPVLVAGLWAATGDAWRLLPNLF